MPHFRFVRWAGIICSFFFPFTARGQLAAVSKITIESAGSGLGQSSLVPSSDLIKIVIQARGGKMYLGETVIEPTQIEALLVALSAPVLPTPQASNLGITREWLHQNSGVVPRKGAPNQRELFRESFSDPKIIEQLLPFRFQFLMFDDYPAIRITVAFANGQRWVAASDSYHPFMLPWRVDLNGQERTTYNADVSRAIAALMPAGSLNRNRLSDDELRKQLADDVLLHIRNQWDLLDVENRAPGSLAILQRSFEIERAEINSYRSVDYGYVAKEPAPYEENLVAILRKSSLPPHVAEDVALAFHNGKIEGAEDLAERIAPYEAVAFSVPWLDLYLADHPEQPLYIRFVHERSFSPKAMQNFAADMKELGKESLANEVAAVQDQAALVFLDYGSWWIILPDKRMILWRHYLPAGFLKWQTTDFKFQRCADYNSNGGGCVGAVVSADGTLVQ